jgi:hypothetical protein
LPPILVVSLVSHQKTWYTEPFSEQATLGISFHLSGNEQVNIKTFTLI